jgi:hypothetical protein
MLNKMKGIVRHDSLSFPNDGKKNPYILQIPDIGLFSVE